MIRIRLRRTGKKHRPSYRLVVADKPNKRDGAFLETLGSYDPHADPPLVTVDAEKVKAWIGKGAQPSEAAEKILRRAGVITTPAPVRKVVAPAAPKAAAAPAPAAAAPVAAAPAPAAAPVAAAPAPEALATEADAAPEASAPETAPEAAVAEAAPEPVAEAPAETAPEAEAAAKEEA